MLLPRVLSALVGIPVLLYLIHVGSLPFQALIVVVAALSLYEYSLMLFLAGRPIQRWSAVLGGAALAMALTMSPPALTADRPGLAALAVTLILTAVCLREMFSPEHSIDRAAATLFGIFFVSWGISHVSLIRDLRPDGEKLTYIYFLTVWLCDTAAYFVGKSIGKRRLAPAISPGKTWEGAIAGFAASVLASAALWHYLLPGKPLLLGLLSGVLIGTMGQASDLAESMVKRAVGAKDSSNLLPGHGGVLDRFDSFFLTAPLLYFALSWK